MTERRAGMAEGARRYDGRVACDRGGAWPLTPHLTSPLEGGRDELG